MLLEARSAAWTKLFATWVFAADRPQQYQSFNDILENARAKRLASSRSRKNKIAAKNQRITDLDHGNKGGHRKPIVIEHREPGNSVHLIKRFSRGEHGLTQEFSTARAHYWQSLVLSSEGKLFFITTPEPSKVQQPGTSSMGRAFREWPVDRLHT